LIDFLINSNWLNIISVWYY